ncbi:unnamed protein product [Knipowitschia caucasica]
MAEADTDLTVFEGSSPGDVCRARQLWSSLSLLPPQEPRLESADILQRLPVSRPQPRRGHRGATATATGDPRSLKEERREAQEEERRRYQAMAENRRQVLGLLRKQREQRIQREMVSIDFNPRPKQEEKRISRNEDGSDHDRDLVQQLS